MTAILWILLAVYLVGAFAFPAVVFKRLTGRWNFTHLWLVWPIPFTRNLIAEIRKDRANPIPEKGSAPAKPFRDVEP